MKKLFTIILILIAVFGLYFFFTRDTSVNLPGQSNPNETGSSFRPDPSNATYIFDDGSITLSSGSRVTSSGEEVSVLEERAYGDLNGDGKEDVALLLSRFGGGSGVFISAGAYISGPVNYRGTNTIFLGDRVSPQSITISNGVITVNYLERSEDEPFSAEPTIPASKQLMLQNGELVER